MENTSLWMLPALSATGVVAGFLNVLAGGGSLLTLPLLIFLGLPATEANGTNRIAILVQNFFAVTGFRRSGVFPWRLALLCAAPALAGSLIGANWAVDIDEALFRRLLALVMLGVLLFMAVDPVKRLGPREIAMTPLRVAVLLLTFFVIGIYGGFIQGGVGFLIISALLVHGLDLVRINALKVMVILFFTITALGVFIANGQVNYGLGLVLAAGNAAGGWFASHLAVKKGHDWIKRILTLVLVAMAVKLLWG